MNNRVIILANGAMKDKKFHLDIIREDDYIICADGGAVHALALGIKPALVMGDLDSTGSDVIKKMEAMNVEIISYPVIKDKTDLELAMDKAVSMSPSSIILLGAAGHRFDHMLANVFLLTLPVKAGISVSMVDETNQIILLGPTVNEALIKGNCGDTVTLLPLSQIVKGISTEGLKYPLQGDLLQFSSSRGVSNEITVSGQARVSIKDGLLLVITIS